MNEVDSRMQQIEQLVRELEEIADPAARSAATELMTAVMEMHGEALARLVQSIGAEATRRVAADELIRSVLLLYDLHPDDLEGRIRAALEEVKPYIESHGGRVELTSVDGDVVRLHLDGSCGGCPSSARTVKHAIEGAILAAAPEIRQVVADGAEGPSNGDSNTREWTVVGDLAPISDGNGRVMTVSGRSLFFCRAGENYYAWGSVCPGCGSLLEGSTIEAGALRCGDCGRRFDLRAAGRSTDDPVLRLEPFPLLVEQGRARVALPSETG